MNALLIVDVQNDFLPGGALAVPEGDRVIPVINRLQPSFELVVATQDWHPANHGSFTATHPGRRPSQFIVLDGLQQILWPVHCVQNTPGAAFAPALDRTRWSHLVQKGTNPQIDSYSAFFDNAHRQATGLADYLQAQGVTDLYLTGLATDYCVKHTAFDALQLGFRTHLIADACRGVNLHPTDTQTALAAMQDAGATILNETDLYQTLTAATR